MRTYDDACMAWNAAADDEARKMGHPDPIGCVMGDALDRDVEEFLLAAESCLREVREIWDRRSPK
jgi:hypothetical protein